MDKNDRPTDMGINRTGIGLSPLDGPLMVEGAKTSPPTSAGSSRDSAALRLMYASEAGTVGKMPPPLTVRGVANTAVEMIKGNKPTVLLDKLAERMAFERSGVRLYDGLLVKLEASGSWTGGPTRQELLTFRSDEASHMVMVEEVLRGLGADPTAMTPSADLAGVESLGVVQVIQDPRTSLAQALHAQLVAELTDTAGWDLLIGLTEALGHSDLTAKFRRALAAEMVHRDTVTRWLAAHCELAARGELGRAASA